MNNRNDQPAWKDISIKPTPKRVMLSDGTFVEEKRNMIPFSFKLVDPAGWVALVPHANGATIRGWMDNPYGNFIRELKKFQGFLIYHTCPYVQGIPVQGDDKPCTDRDRLTGPRSMTRKPSEECCEHMTALIKRRVEAQTRHGEEKAAAFRTQSEKQLEITVKALQALAESGSVQTDDAPSEMFRGKRGSK